MSPNMPPDGIDTMWTMESALTFIRTWWDAAYERGWILALTGGVLRNGSSTHDLDLIAHARGSASVVQSLTALFPGMWCSTEAGVPIWACIDNGRRVELSFPMIPRFRHPPLEAFRDKRVCLREGRGPHVPAGHTGTVVMFLGEAMVRLDAHADLDAIYYLPHLTPDDFQVLPDLPDFDPFAEE